LKKKGKKKSGKKKERALKLRKGQVKAQLLKKKVDHDRGQISEGT